MPGPLIVVPTSSEMKIIEPLLRPNVERAGGTLRLCGFGPVAAAARTSQLIAQLKPDEIVLVGIAGSIGDVLPVGTASTFDSVCCHGIGVGAAEHFESASSLGWPQWDDDSTNKKNIGDIIALRRGNAGKSTQADGHRQLLTCCAGSASTADVEFKRQVWPEAIAEDMEGFGVAMAATLAEIPVQIVRGISNQAGDRRLSQWKIQDALESAVQLAFNLIADGGQSS